MNTKRALDFGKEVISDWLDHKAMRLAAALAFYSALSIAPMLVIVIAIAGLVFGRDAASGEIVGQLEGLLGHDGAQAVQAMVKASSNFHTGVVAMIVGIVLLLVGATGAFAELQDSLNTVWGVAPKPGRGVLGILRDRSLTFAMVVALGFLLLVSLVVSAALSAIGDHIHSLGTHFAIVGQAIHLVIGLGVVTVLFAMIFKILPDAKIRWRDVWLGAFLTSLLFTIGKYLIGLYLGHSSIDSTYGAAGSLVVLLLWVYYSAQILFLGAEITQVLARLRGEGIVPNERAVALTDVDRHKQGIVHDDELAAVVDAHHHPA